MEKILDRRLLDDSTLGCGNAARGVYDREDMAYNRKGLG
jgi:hypothetical protein